LEWGNGQISDLSPIEDLKNLVQLQVRGQRITELAPLARLQRLEHLNLDNNQIKDFSPIASLGSLRDLQLWGNQVSFIPDLSGMRSLQWIQLGDNQISVFEGFEGSPVDNISLDRNNIKVVNVNGLANLRHLQLRRNPLEKLSFADGQRIDALSIDETGFVDFEALQNVSDSLGHIDAVGNGLQSAAVFSAFTNMWHLNIENNDISTIGAAFDSMSGSNVYMSGNPLLCTEEARLGELPVNVYFNGQCATDSDGDGSVDGRDAFPSDVAASVDTDGDGAPDDWNEGYSASDSTTGLSIDNDDDEDGVADSADAFPNDASESLDSDGDGLGDNKDAYPNDS